MILAMDKSRRLTKAEWGVCVAATLAALWLHLSFWWHAGGFWRDEATSVYIGTSGSLGQMWHMLQYESFPALFPATIRLWSSIGFGSSELAFRALGFLAGLSFLAALWFSARVLTGSLPFISLALLATNLTVLRWGDSLRAYGFGCTLILATLILVWLLIKKPDAKRFTAATIAAVLSVQCLYQNAFLLLAICVAAGFVCFRRGLEKRAGLVTGVGAVAAVSLLPYVGIMTASQRSFAVARIGFNASAAWGSWADALGNPGVWQVPFWIGICFAAAVRGLIFVSSTQRRQSVSDEDLPLFAAMTLSFSVVLFVLFLAIAWLPTQPWYWLPPMALVAVCADACLRDWLAPYRIWRFALVALLVFVSFLLDLKPIKRRQTTIDLVAIRLQQEAGPKDLILVYPWYCGVTFTRYYHGATPWVTLPILSDFRIARYDLLREKLEATNPMQPILERIGHTLDTGGRLWIVGTLPPPKPDETEVPDLPPAPNGPQGWFDVPYTYVWGRQVEHFIGAGQRRIEEVPIDFGEGVNIYEDAPLAVVK